MLVGLFKKDSTLFESEALRTKVEKFYLEANEFELADLAMFFYTKIEP